jgi:protein TonB
MTFDSVEMKAFANRRLRYAIAASLLLHLLAFWFYAPHNLTDDAPALLNATLRKPPQQRPKAVPNVPAKPIPRTAPLASTAAPTAPRPEPHLLEQPRPASVPQIATPAPEKPATPASVPQPPAATASSTSSSPTADVLLTEGGATGEAVEGLRGYRLAVATQARRFKRYPRQAMAAGLTGSAEIRVEVGRDGRPRPATVARSSGHELLDLAALSMIDAGATRARLPESLRGRAFAVVLPVFFNLDDEE